MFIESVPWLIIKIGQINWIAVYNLKDKNYTGRMLMESLVHLVNYMSRRFNLVIKRPRFNSETKLTTYEIDLNDLGLELCISPSGIHVGRIERTIRHFKDRFRCMKYDLPYNLNSKYIVYLVREIAFIINHTSDGTALTPFEY